MDDVRRSGMGSKIKKEQLLKSLLGQSAGQKIHLKPKKIKIWESSKEIQKHQKIPIEKQLMDVDINRSLGGC